MKLAADSPTGLGAMMAGGRTTASKSERHAWDYYQTPADCARAILLAEAHHIRMHATVAWDPCGHGGRLLDAGRAAGFDMLGTDLRADPAHGVIARDLLGIRRLMAPAILTNFP